MTMDVGKTNISQYTYYFIIAGVIGIIIRLFDSYLKISAKYLDMNNSFIFDIFPKIIENRSFLYDILFFGLLLLFLGFIGLSIHRGKATTFLIVYFSVLIVQYLLVRFDIISLTWELTFIRNIIILIPILILFSYLSQKHKISLYIIILYVFEYILRESSILLDGIVRPLFDESFPEGLSALGDVQDLITSGIYVIIFVNLILMLIMLLRILPKSKLLIGQTAYTDEVTTAPSSDGPNVATTVQKSSTAEYSSFPADFKPMDIPILGKRWGIPMIKFWCQSCDKMVKFNTRGWKNEDFETPHSCPSCSGTALVFYVRPEVNRYYKFIIGIMILAGGIITSQVEGTFGNYGVEPAAIIFGLSIIEIIIGGIVLYQSTRIIYTAPPSYATETLKMLPTSTFLSEMTIIVILGLIGGAAIWGLNSLILAILI